MGLRILVVDDAAFVRDTMKRTLRQMVPNADIVEAVDGNRAISMMKSKNIDLVLSDWEMPEMSGEEFLQWVRAQPKYFDTPFIMVSSRGDRNHVVLAVNAGVTDYITKPFTPEELQKKVGKQLKKIGYAPKESQQAQGTAFSSVGVLTGAKQKSVQKPREVKSAAGFGKPQAKKAAAKGAAKASSFEGRAQLRFPNLTCECEIKEMSLQAFNGVIQRPESDLPHVFEQAVVDMENGKGEALARLNGYVHSLQAAEPRPDTTKIKIIIRFVDNDPDKFEALSKFIAKN